MQKILTLALAFCALGSQVSANESLLLDALNQGRRDVSDFQNAMTDAHSREEVSQEQHESEVVEMNLGQINALREFQESNLCKTPCASVQFTGYLRERTQDNTPVSYSFFAFQDVESGSKYAWKEFVNDLKTRNPNFVGLKVTVRHRGLESKQLVIEKAVFTGLDAQYTYTFLTGDKLAKKP